MAENITAFAYTSILLEYSNSESHRPAFHLKKRLSLPGRRFIQIYFHLTHIRSAKRKFTIERQRLRQD
ncbi:hypothetical protein MFRU_012g00560 [Monilinia fructicola]|nr:hypothetical protein MFRU_012g00560 [Monilinia fructicola]